MKRIIRLPLTLISILRKHGIFYLFSFIISYVYLTIRQLIWKKRFDLYDFTASGQPEKNGFLVPAEEWQLDTPNKSINLKKFSDDAFVFGTNSKSESLAVHVSRLPNGFVRCSLVLQTSDGKLYSLPKEHIIQKATSEEHTFGSSRLKLQCESPMRKWRIFFNGILEESPQDSKSNQIDYKHVRLTFLWTASSEIFDFLHDMSISQLSHKAACTPSMKMLPIFFLKKIQSIFDRFEQPGMLLGTVQIGTGPEQEMYLWGSRKRFMGKMSSIKNSNCVEVDGHLQDGSIVNIGVLSIPGVVKEFAYGYMMLPNGFIHPIEKFDYQIINLPNEQIIIKCRAAGKTFDIRVDTVQEKGNAFQKEWEGPASVKAAKVVVNKKEGTGFIFKGYITKSERMTINKSNTILEGVSRDLNAKDSLTVTFKDKYCKLSELCGGKGSSLGKLFALAASTNQNRVYSEFAVPNGIVVTTKAYTEFTKHGLEHTITAFEKEVWSKKSHDSIKPLCQRIVGLVSQTKIPESVISCIERDLKSVFGDSYSKQKFAVRSSATGEDTEQMSAAGQMETFLGVKGLNEILTAVSKCWASQFTFQAVEYKRRYGQRLNTPMAVVIQEMIPCDAAGVMFTCDPVTANPAYINITANWGLGESVVSASAEPDTIVLERNITNELKLHSKQLGNKKTKIIMADSNGTKEVDLGNDSSSVCCISDAVALTLGKIALKVEEEYGSPRDIEWGISKGKVFLFQSRPVTSIDVGTEFENMHWTDSALRCEKEIITRGHVGEVMPGAVSVIGHDVVLRSMCLSNAKMTVKLDAEDVPNVPYYQKGIVSAYSQFFFNLVTGMFKFNESDEEFNKAFVVAFFGRFIEDKEIRKMSMERHPENKMSLKRMISVPIFLTFVSFFAGSLARRTARKLRNFKIPLEYKNTSLEIFQAIAKYFDIPFSGMVAHMKCSTSSTLWNASILSLLAKVEGKWNNVVYSDFAYLLSTITAVESANVPASIEELGYVISKNIKPSKFREMDPEEALTWLQKSNTEAAEKFRIFLQRHGHRCIKEFDFYSKVWAKNPISLVKTLQGIVSENATINPEKKADSFRVVLSKLKVKLNFIEKLKLFWLLPNTRRAVSERELSKAFLMKPYDALRDGFHRLAEQMVLEGRLSNEADLFFLNFEEIRQLIKNRSPKLVTRAFHRRKCYEIADKLIFPEFITGIPKPMNMDEPILTGKGFSMTGVPVSRGVVKAPARVIKHVNEAHTIKQGEILIAYSTDIAWSPYFPLLSGVVTELGGLISHGAVVAREYGLPCVVSLPGVTRAFKTGDVVILDGNNGIVQKVDDDD